MGGSSNRNRVLSAERHSRDPRYGSGGGRLRYFQCALLCIAELRDSSRATSSNCRKTTDERRFGGSTCDVISRGPDLVAFKSSGNQATSGTQWENRQAQRPCLHYHAEQDAVSARGNARQRYTRRRSFVRESPPVGETAIEWMLFTSEPIGTLAEIEAVVAHYPARWIIEEYFKALKTGCAFEKRQL